MGITGIYFDGYMVALEEGYLRDLTLARDQELFTTMDKYETVDCPICGDNKVKTLVEDVDKGDVGECNTCGVLYAYRRVNETIYEILCRYYVPSHMTEPETFKKVASQRLKDINSDIDTIESYVKRGKMLDIGTSCGDILVYARTRGWEVRATELSTLMEELLVSLVLIDTHRGFIDTCEMEDGEFDVISMRHVIEHLSNPVADLKKLHKALKDDGILFISTPEHALDQEYFVTNHMLPLHIVNYTRDTLERLLEATGFYIVEYKADRRELRNHDSADAMQVIAKKKGEDTDGTTNE